MCVNMDDFKELVKSVDSMKEMLSEVRNTGLNTNEKLTVLNGRVYKAEAAIEHVKEDIHTLKRYRAGRFVDCPNREDIDNLKANMLTQKAIRREMRWWFVSGTSAIISVLYLLEKVI